MTKISQSSTPETGRTETKQSEETTQSSGTPPQSKTAEQAARKETKSISEILSTYVAESDTLTGKYNLLRKLRATLDAYMNNPQAYLVEIGVVSTTINDLKKEIAQLEAEQRRDESIPKIPERVLYDTQSILATSTVRRKPDNYAYMEIPRPAEKKSYK